MPGHMDYEINALREAAESMAAALRDNGHDTGDAEDEAECPGCGALAEYARALETPA